MNIRQQFTLTELLDPFTLLKVCQALREIPCGESLEFVCEGRTIPEELFKVLRFEECEIVEEEFNEDLPRCRIVIQKRKTQSSDTDSSQSGWCCS